MTDEHDYDPGLVAWLRAQLDADELVARGTRPTWDEDESSWDLDEVWKRQPHTSHCGYRMGEFGEACCCDVPPFMIADIKAKRRLVAELIRFMEGDYAPWNEAYLQMLALPYADRAGYRDEWRPVEVAE